MFKLNFKSAPYFITTAAFLFSANLASAGEFSVACSYTNDNLQKCASAISDIVTDKFIEKFPATKYQIFVHSDILGFTDGGYSAYSISGVIPKNSAQFPLNRFSSTKINRSNKKFSAVELANVELETFRSAVNSLMEQCEISPTCDVYTGKDKK